jgi:rRNA maturation endonuclease Nob1
VFEDQYNEEMEAEVRRLEAKRRAAEAGHPEWENACSVCGRKLALADGEMCGECGGKGERGRS